MSRLFHCADSQVAGSARSSQEYGGITCHTCVKLDCHDAMEKFPLKGTSLNSAIPHSNANAVTTYHSVDAKVCRWIKSASSCIPEEYTSDSPAFLLHVSLFCLFNSAFTVVHTSCMC